MLIAYIGYKNGDFQTTQENQNTLSYNQKKPANDNNIIITDYAKEHVLYGNKSGGGHKFGVGKPCKSEFPKNWDDKKIFNEITRLAANDNIKWRQEDNGYYASEQTVEKINIRIILGKNKQKLITAYPTNTKRNPCTHYND